MKIYFTLLLVLNFLVPYGIIIIFSVNILIFLRNWAQASNKLINIRVREKAVRIDDKQARSSIAKTVSAFPLKSAERKESNIESERISIANTKTRSYNTLLFNKIKHEKTISKHESNYLDDTLSFVRRISIFATRRNEIKGLETRVNMIKKRTTFFVLAVAISYLITWSPLWAFQVYVEFGENETQYIQIINSFIFVLHYLNGVINPLLFMLLTQNYKEYYSKLKSDFQKTFKKSEFEQYIAKRNHYTYQTTVNM